MYLLTGLIYPDNPKYHENGSLKDITDINLESIGIVLSYVEIKKPTYKTGGIGNNRRFVYSLLNGEIDDQLAQNFADALMVALAVRYDIGIDDPPIPLRLHKSQIKAGEIIQWQDIVNSDDRYIKESFLWHMSIGLPPNILTWAFQAIPVLIHNPSIMNSCSFYRESILKIWHCEEDIAEMILDGDTPTSVVERANIETAYHNAFKAIEALIGQPSKDKNKLRIQLHEQGINPDEIVGYDTLRGKNEETILKKVLVMLENRNHKAAHGKTDKPRDIGYLELADKQKLAKYMIRQNISYVSMCKYHNGLHA